MSRGSGTGSDKYNYLMKVIIVGDSGTGKSCLLHRFIEDTFYEDQTQTIGVEFGAKIVSLGNNKRVKLQIWDTAGQERYKSVTRSYYRGAVACLIVYDISNRSSFEHVPQWLTDVRRLAGDDATVMIIGNKADLALSGEENGDKVDNGRKIEQNKGENNNLGGTSSGSRNRLGGSGKRQVSHNEGSLYAQQHGLMHFETSAATGELVSEAFLKTAKMALLKMTGSDGGKGDNNNSKGDEEGEDEDQQGEEDLIDLSSEGGGNNSNGSRRVKRCLGC